MNLSDIMEDFEKAGYPLKRLDEGSEEEHSEEENMEVTRYVSYTFRSKKSLSMYYKPANEIANSLHKRFVSKYDTIIVYTNCQKEDSFYYLGVFVSIKTRDPTTETLSKE